MDARTTTADRISDVALHLFSAHGYAGVSMEQIRREAAVSTGSLYHHFRSRAAVAAHLFLSGMTEVQQRAQRALADAAAHPESGIRRVVEQHLDWVEHHPDLGRLVYGEVPDEVLLAAEPALAAHNRAYVSTVHGWLRRHMDDGALAPRPFGVAHALWVGPAQELCRHWLRGRSRVSPVEAGPDLADGAWAALARPGQDPRA